MNRKGRLILTAILSVVMIFSGALFVLLSKNKSGEVETVQALNYKEYTGLDDVSVTAYRSKRGNVGLTSYPINNGDFVMLYNNNKTSTDSTRDIVLFSIEAINGKKLTVLDVNVTLNGQNIVYNGYTDSDEEDASATTNKSLKMRLTGVASDLAYQTESLGDVLSAEGYYEFYFRVSVDGGTIYPIETGYFYHFGLYLLNESSYCQADQIPTPGNVNPDLDAESNTFYDNKYIFNYNEFTEDEDRDPLYPAIKFDPEKYDLSFARTYRNNVENITTRFKYTTADFKDTTAVTNYGLLTFNYDVSNKQVAFKMERDANGFFIFEEKFNYGASGTENYYEPLLKELGVYEIKKQYKLYTNSGFVCENKEEGNVALKKDLLTVFGYVAHYAEAGSGSAEFNSYTTEEYSDISKFAADGVNAGEKVINLTANSFTKFLSDHKVVSTNQAPVWFEYNGVLVEGKYWYTDSPYINWKDSSQPLVYMFDENGELDITKAQNYTKSDYFEQSGYYIVRLKYRMETDIGNTPTFFTQFIAFQLRNVSPKASTQASLNGTFEGDDLEDIDSNTFTKGSVRFAIEEKSTFDSDINLYYTYSPTFENNGKRGTFTPYYTGEKNDDYTVFTQAGLYRVEVHFGSGSYSVYSFSIDKQELTEVININGVKAYVNSRNEVEFQIDETKKFTDKNYVNEAFTIYANKKLSGAAISATVRTISVESYNSTDDYIARNLVSAYGQYWMNIGYKAQNISSAQDYSFVRSDSSLRISNENNIFTNQKIYIFEFADKAGYTATYIMFLDLTKTEIMQRPAGASVNTVPDSFNVVSEPTELQWGTHKVIKFEQSAFQSGYREKLIQYAPDVYVDYISELYIVIPITNVTIKQEELALGGKEQTHVINRLNYNSRMVTVYPRESDLPEESETKTLYGEGFYNVSILDDAGNKLEYRLEMNLDKSQVKCLATSELNAEGDEIANPEYHSSNQIREQQATSRYGMFISFINSDASGNDTFAIKSLTYTYYPYDLSIENKNLANSTYPYAANPTIVDEDILTNNEYGTNENQYITDIIKEEAYETADGNVPATAPGKYVITRIYKGDEAEIGATGDVKVRVYTFYVDRNPVIDVPNFTDLTEPYIGDGIYFELGSEKIPFNEFYRGIYKSGQEIAKIYDFFTQDVTTVKKDLSLVTNLIPLKIYVPANKYNVAPSRALKTYSLTVKVTHYNNSQFVSETLYTASSGQSMIEIPDLKLPGFYVIEMYDMAIEPNSQITPNKNSLGYFTLHISLDKPQGYFQTAKDPKPELNKGENPRMEFSITEQGEFYFEYEETASEGLVYNVYRAEQTASTSFSNYRLLTDKEYNPIEVGNNSDRKALVLPAFGYEEGVLKTYKYKITYTDKGVDYEHITPVMADFGAFTELTRTSTKEDVLEFTFTDPIDKYYARIDISKIIIERYIKEVNGSFKKDTNYSISGDDILSLIETRLVSENRRFYSITLDAAAGKDGLGNEYIYFIHLSYYGDANDYENPEDFKTYHSNVQTLLIDRTPPSYFLEQLISKNQEALATFGVTETSKLYSYESGDGVYYYARVSDFDYKIEGGFKFTRKPATQYISQDQETQYLYMRQYPKYDMSLPEDKLNTTYQSLIPGDPAFYDVSSLNLRFDNTNLETWHKIEYTGQTFAEIVAQKFSGQSGYYEMIEVDEAGNHTVYTVRYSNVDAVIELNYTEQYGVNSDRRTNHDKGDITAINSFAITSISGEMGTQLPDMWFTIKLAGTVYTVTPSTDLEELIAQMNQTFVVGNAYPIEISNRFGSVFKCNIRVVNQDLYLDDPYAVYVESENWYHVYIPNDTDLIELKTMQVYKYNVDFAEWTLLAINEYLPNTRQQGDTFDFATMSDEFTTGYRIVYLEENVYKFRFTDNIRNDNNLAGNKYYEVSLKVGVDDTLEWQFSPNTYNDKNNNNIKTTDGDVVLVYNNAIYEVVAYLNDEVYPNTVEGDDEKVSLVFTAPKNVSDINVRSGGKYTYTVKITDRITSEVKTETFVIYNIFPAVQVTDSTGSSMIGVIAIRHSETQNIELTSFTSKAIYFVWEQGMEYGYSVTLHKYTSNYAQLISSSSVGGDKLTVSTEGVYALEFKNTFLQSTKSLCFIIKDSTISMYAVYENVPNEGYKILSPSSVMIDLDTCSHIDGVDITSWDALIAEYTGIRKEYPKTVVDGVRKFMVKSYFTNYSISIEVEGDKLIKTNYTDIISNETDNVIKKKFQIKNELNEGFESYVIVVYGQTPYSYLDVFVVTRVASSTSIIETVGYQYKNAEDGLDMFTINHTSTDYIQVYVSPCTLTWSSFYGMAQNTISVAYYFNNRYIETTLGTDLGDVRAFELKTPGEYKFIFTDLAGNTQRFGTSGSKELTVLLLSEVVYKVNGSDPIYGAVYNEAVTLSIEDSTRYEGLTVLAFKNGEPYEITPVKNVYTFSEVGVYKVTLNADVTYGSSRTSLTEAVSMFTIVNKNEARFAYEFTDLNGYEIVKVMKGGFLDEVSDYIDITEIIKSTNNVVTIYNLVISADQFGTGKYQIFVEGTQDNVLMEGQGFAFDVWINNEVPVITSSIEAGTSTLDPIVISFNATSIYDQIGESKLVVYRKVGTTIMGTIEYESVINELTVPNQTITVADNGEFYVALVTSAGNVVSMFKVTKEEPLNTVAIIIIVVAILVVIVGTIIFVKLRLKMSVK